MITTVFMHSIFCAQVLWLESLARARRLFEGSEIPNSGFRWLNSGFAGSVPAMIRSMSMRNDARSSLMESNVSIQEIIDAERELLDERAAAALLDVCPGTLSVWRSTGRYSLPFLKVGRKVRYRRADLASWLESRARMSGATQ